MSLTATKENRIDLLFKNKKGNVLSVYFTAGYPRIDDTASVIHCLQEAGADMIEIGIPYSDPVADGPTIQDSNQVALNNGMTMKLLMEQIKEIRQKVDIPLILMGYFNPILQFGIKQFCEDCEKIGIDAVIVPDLPIQEYLDQYKNIFEAHSLHNIFLISPQTSEKRIRMIDENTGGFIYMVSSAGTTGAKTGISAEQEVYFQKIKNMNLKNPTLIGFGISDHQTFTKACNYASGAIIGSAFIKTLAKSSDHQQDVQTFINKVRNG